ncbi:serine aminopeptidase domain-containing protein [Plantactinospora sp. GCM10030261]|uniref:serine aminopeptidase domain-containing protein n=1 Tax=Plantactinospora sp. GCM10030261 TaxID=3273420 RepID=UPI00361C3913
MRQVWRGDRRLVGLLLLGAIPAAVESAVLTGVGFRSAQGQGPQVTAVWPYDVYHDLRWLLVYHDSWVTFGLEWVVMVLGRGLLSAGFVVLAWPREVPRPGVRDLAMRNLVLAAVASVILSPWAALNLAAGVVALSWYLFASLIPLFLLAPFLQRAGAVSGWWRGLPSIEMVGWSLLNFALITAAGAAIWSVPAWLNVPVAAIAGAANGLLWQRVVCAAVLPRRTRWRRVPVAPVAVVLTLLAPLAVRAATGAKTGTQGEWEVPVLNQPLPDSIDHAVIALAGYDSVYDGAPAVDPDVERFSYLGIDERGRPRPYPAQATHGSLESSAALLDAQVRKLHERTRKPVALIGQSQGAMVARLYLRMYPGSPVDTVMLFSPLVRAGRTYYPPAEADSGWGLAAGWLIRGLFAVSNQVSKVKDDPDDGFVRSLLEEAPFWRNETLCPVWGVRMIAFIPTITAAEAPPLEYARIPVYQLPAFHGGLLGRPVVQDRIFSYLGGEELNRPTGEYTVLQRLSAAWQAPPLFLSLNPAWADNEGPDPARTGRICQPR